MSMKFKIGGGLVVAFAATVAIVCNQGEPDVAKKSGISQGSVVESKILDGSAVDLDEMFMSLVGDNEVEVLGHGHERCVIEDDGVAVYRTDDSVRVVWRSKNDYGSRPFREYFEDGTQHYGNSVLLKYDEPIVK